MTDKVRFYWRHPNEVNNVTKNQQGFMNRTKKYMHTGRTNCVDKHHAPHQVEHSLMELSREEKSAVALMLALDFCSVLQC